MKTARAYFDTSVLVKRYIHEEGSVKARALLRRHRVVSSTIAPLKAMSALSRRRHEAVLSERNFGDVLGQMRADTERWELVEINQLVLDRVAEVMQLTNVRTLDALHIASALVFQTFSGRAIRFITADTRQREAARSMALSVTELGAA